jgi:hypothetical protein
MPPTIVESRGNIGHIYRCRDPTQSGYNKKYYYAHDAPQTLRPYHYRTRMRTSCSVICMQSSLHTRKNNTCVPSVQLHEDVLEFAKTLEEGVDFGF